MKYEELRSTANIAGLEPMMSLVGNDGRIISINTGGKAVLKAADGGYAKSWGWDEIKAADALIQYEYEREAEAKKVPNVFCGERIGLTFEALGFEKNSEVSSEIYASYLKGDTAIELFFRDDGMVRKFQFLPNGKTTKLELNADEISACAEAFYEHGMINFRRKNNETEAR